jgi:hypothetical protein
MRPIHCIANPLIENTGVIGSQLTYEATRVYTVPQSQRTIRWLAGTHPSSQRTEPSCQRVLVPWKSLEQQVATMSTEVDRCEH